MFDIVKFYKEIYMKIDNKYYSIDKKSTPCGTKKNKYLSQYYFQNSYLRMYYTKEENLEVLITVEKYGPNAREIRLNFNQKELQENKTLELIICILKMIAYSEIAPEYFGFNSNYLSFVNEELENAEQYIPLKKEVFYNALNRYYCRFYQVLLWEIKNIKENPDLWISFVNGKYFLLFEKISNAKESYKNIFNIIQDSNLDENLKSNIIKYLDNYFKNE